MKQLGKLVALVALALAVPGPAQAETRYVVGVENIPYLPYYTWENGAYDGFGREVLDAYAEDRGIVFEYRSMPVQRLFVSFFEGQVDFKFPDSPDWKAEMREGKPLVYSDPVVVYVDGSNIRPEDKGRPVDEVRNVGTMAGFSPWAWLPRLNSGEATLTENGNLQALLHQAINRRIDAAYANIAVVRHQLSLMGQSDALVFDPGLPHVRDYYYLASQKHPEVIADFNVWQKENAGRIAEIARRYNVEVPQR
ncbi:ABC transporter substrate-binding protein [Telmatospirillum sp. J64-1]|uniref:substrate-binding periplasmic protein n=1 Tax=Telmatospirillum sp. J64-1 TaxID=2502183 RepID=UPI00115F2241|nr:transporter substrate-binding domain-containing protein [Telmatospirillum sp. J64-1]